MIRSINPSTLGSRSLALAKYAPHRLASRVATANLFAISSFAKRHSAADIDRNAEEISFRIARFASAVDSSTIARVVVVAIRRRC